MAADSRRPPRAGAAWRCPATPVPGPDGCARAIRPDGRAEYGRLRARRTVAQCDRRTDNTRLVRLAQRDLAGRRAGGAASSCGDLASLVWAGSPAAPWCAGGCDTCGDDGDVERLAAQRHRLPPVRVHGVLDAACPAWQHRI